MKRILTAIVLLSTFQISQAQRYSISGQVKGAEKPDITLQVLADGFFPNQKQVFETSVDGSFRHQIPLAKPRLAYLTCNKVRYRLLMSPGRDVQVTISNETNAPVVFSGKGAAENNLLQELKMEELAFFMKDHEAVNPYAGLRLDSFKTAVLQRVEMLLQEKQALIKKSSIPTPLKALLQSELGYYAQCTLDDFAGGKLRPAKNPDKDTIHQVVMHWRPLPDSAALVNGFYANMILSRYSNYAVNLLGKDFRTNPEAAKARIYAILGLPFEDINQLLTQYGERYVMEWLYASKQLPRNVRSRILYNRIMEACDASLLSTAVYLKDTMQAYFPRTSYAREALQAVSLLNQKHEAAISNSRIIFYDTVKPASLQAMLARHRGKPVYLDIWGTWCGPCRMELGYTPALKKALPPGEVVFIYLAMDHDSKEETWKEMARLNGIEGEHYRLTSSQIPPIWDEIRAAGGLTDRYPTYVLFDREGKIVVPNAGSPSEGEKTIEQIKGVIEGINTVPVEKNAH